MPLTRLSGPHLLNTKQEPPRKIDKGLILLMAEILHQLRLVVYPIICGVLYIPGGCLGFLPSTVAGSHGGIVVAS